MTSNQRPSTRKNPKTCSLCGKACRSPICTACMRKTMQSFTCNRCGKEGTKSLFAVQKTGFTCTACLRPSPFSKEEIREQVRQSNLQKYGVENAGSTPKARAKAKQTSLERFGAENYLATKEAQDRIKDTNRQKYGTDNPLASSEIQAKVRETNRIKYGGSYRTTSEGKEKYRQTCLGRYGVDNPMKLDSVKQKVENTLQDRYGVSRYAQTGEFHRKKKGKYIADSFIFDSSWELIYYLYRRDHGIPIERNVETAFEYIIDGKSRLFYPDFKEGNSFVEVKGDHLIAGIFPLNNAIAKKDYCEKHNIKVLSGQDIALYKPYVLQTYGKAFKEIHTPEFIYLWNQALEYRNKPLHIIQKNEEVTSHPSIWTCRVGSNKTPYEALHDDNLLTKAILNQLKYSEGDMSFKMTMQRFTIARLAPRVSIFKPSLAKRLITTYLSPYNTIFDPCSGFSGRLIGAMESKKTYIGQDINLTTVTEANELIRRKGWSNQASVTQKDLFESTGKYECLFTCTPYNLKETWGQPIRNLSCDEWIDACISRFDCEAYLFVVDDVIKYSSYIVESLQNKNHFGIMKGEKVVLILKETSKK